MPLDPINDKVQIYNQDTKKQRLADVTDFANTPIVPVVPYLGLVTTPQAVTAGAPLVLVFTPPFDARNALDTALSPGFYNVVFMLTGTIDHTTGDPNDRYGAKIRATVTVGASTSTAQAPVVFDGEDFTISINRMFQIADGETIVVELVSDVDGDINPIQCYLQAAYLYA